jgi:hypothetical protein
VKYKHIYLTLLYFTLLYLTLPFFCFVTKPTDQTTEPISRTISQTTRIASRKCLFGVSSMKKNFHGGISLPQNFQRAFYMQIEKSNNFGQVKDNRKNSKTDLYQIGVKQSNGDFTSGLASPLAAEIVFLPLSAITKALITSKRYKIDGKCL